MDNSYKTAISRKKCSAPIRWAFEEGYITPKDSIFDWGCGKGADMRWLKEKGCKIIGYDPHYAPENHPNIVDFSKIDLIICNYVLNVIEDKTVRQAVVDNMINVAAPGQTYFIISVRSEKEIEKQGDKSGWEYSGDGRITKTGTFQKGFNEFELLDMIDNRLTQICLKKVSGGYIYVFVKDKE